MRDKLFISHATPNDNAFAAWLATKLELHGYSVWVDVNELDPASDFWKEIENTIRDEAIIFLFVATRDSVLNQRDGVMKELAVADRVRKSIPDFIVPLRVDDVSFDDFPVEIVRQNAIVFTDDWATGLLQLLDYLEKLNIPRNQIETDMSSAVSRWREIKTAETSSPIRLQNYYYSNLFPCTLPEYLFVYSEFSESTFKSKHIPYKKIESYIVTYACSNCVGSDPIASFSVAAIIKDDGNILVNGFEIRSAKRICTDLLNWTMDNYFYSSGLRRFKPASLRRNKNRYFFNIGIKSKRHEKSRPKFLSGKYRGKNWHYGLTAYYTDFPTSGILFRWHLVFTDENGNILSDSQQIAARRSKGRLFFNKEWRDLLQAAIYALSKGENHLAVDLCCENTQMTLRQKPFSLTSKFGYYEPSTDPGEMIKEYDDEE